MHQKQTDMPRLQNIVLATSTGYVMSMNQYQRNSVLYDKSLGLGYWVVTNLLDVLPRKFLSVSDIL